VPPVGDSHDGEALLQRIKQNVSSIVDALENRFLYLIKEREGGAIPSEDVVEELSPLLRDLRRCFSRLVDVEEREDLSFRAATDLHELDRRCLWLFRKMRMQQKLTRKLILEAKLRDLVPSEAFNVYQMVLDLDEEERASRAIDDATIRALMLQEME
jgi:hypothetical protein